MFIKDPNLSSSATTGVLAVPNQDDPYRYQYGFGNHHVSEAVPGALPRNGTNLPQKCPYDLYAEHLNGTSFISSRETVSNVWMYRIRPASAHRRMQPAKNTSRMESCFLPLNPGVEFTPTSHTWGPLPIADPGSGETTTFVQGLRTICGHGDPTIKEGLAVHMYAFNADMRRQAFVNNDGDLLLVPHKGDLDIQTELGHLRVRPGDIAVLPAGFRFAVRLVPPPNSALHSPADGRAGPRGASGYALELFGTHFALPDLGPLGGNALALVRDFEHPVASFDLDPPVNAAAPPSASSAMPPWEVITKLSGRFYSYVQPHTPFDVVAWHGRYAPYKYTLSRFGALTANTDQLDPTAYCVLTAPSKWPGVSLVDFCVFGEKYFVARDTYQPPYHHRTMATELVGVIRGEYKGSVRPMVEGGLGFEQAYGPHGETYEAWVAARERELVAGKVAVGYLGFMFHVSSHVALTRWAMEEHPDIKHERENLWDSVQGHFLDNIDEINRNLVRAGMPMLETRGAGSAIAPSAPNGL